jgi:hypothetical protein
MEPRFGQDFGRVRVHISPRAAQSAQAVSARAYTVGSDVVFGHGEYSPGTEEGKRLIAHELTHVVQQEGAVRTNQISQPMDPLEDQADKTASQAVSPQRKALSISSCGWCAPDPAASHANLSKGKDQRRRCNNWEADLTGLESTPVFRRWKPQQSLI